MIFISDNPIIFYDNFRYYLLYLFLFTRFYCRQTNDNKKQQQIKIIIASKLILNLIKYLATNIFERRKNVTYENCNKSRWIILNKTIAEI